MGNRAALVAKIRHIGDGDVEVEEEKIIAQEAKEEEQWTDERLAWVLDASSERSKHWGGA